MSVFIYVRCFRCTSLSHTHPCATLPANVPSIEGDLLFSSNRPSSLERPIGRPVVESIDFGRRLPSKLPFHRRSLSLFTFTFSPFSFPIEFHQIISIAVLSFHGLDTTSGRSQRPSQLPLVNGREKYSSSETISKNQI